MQNTNLFQLKIEKVAMTCIHLQVHIFCATFRAISVFLYHSGRTVIVGRSLGEIQKVCMYVCMYVYCVCVQQIALFIWKLKINVYVSYHHQCGFMILCTE